MIDVNGRLKFFEVFKKQFASKQTIKLIKLILVEDTLDRFL